MEGSKVAISSLDNVDAATWAQLSVLPYTELEHNVGPIASPHPPIPQSHLAHLWTTIYDKERVNGR